MIPDTGSSRPERCLLLDLDGTIIDSSPGIMRCFRLGLESCGISGVSDERLRAVIGPTLYYSYRELFGLPEEDAQRAVKIYRAEYFERGYTECRVYPGMPEALSELKSAGVRLALATTKPELMARRIAAHCGFGVLLEEICGAELSGERSEKPELIRCVLERLGISDMSRVAMAGDRSYDMLGARATGVYALGAAWGFGTREELVSSGAQLIAQSPYELAEGFNKLCKC